ncbi:hypothetical protein NQ317_009146 [Molorchus minor]|uniref:Uncharacterized protein n=1 Tax=Molorchus minor TaxID=1323400 RepID=A0ABQ9K0U4_9CUCU|nr:hypothetical protein NQ317_009146 [Molorchus minor]
MESAVCASCLDSLTTYNNFVTICESTEERINLYHDMQQGRAIIKLRDVLTFLIKCITDNVNIKKEGALNNKEYRLQGSDVKEEVLDKYEGATCNYEIKHKMNLKRSRCESPIKHGGYVLVSAEVALF